MRSKKLLIKRDSGSLEKVEKLLVREYQKKYS